MQRGKLKPEDEDCIRKHYFELKQNIDALQLIDLLYSEKVISDDQKEMIFSKSVKRERNEILLQAVLDSGPGDNFDKFIAALKINYSHLKIVEERSKLYGVQEGQDSSMPGEFGTCNFQLEVKVNSYDITLLLNGESNCGKSSTCASLIRFDREDISTTQSFENKDIHTRQFNGRKIHFVDSPSIEHYRSDSHKLINEVQDSIDRVSEGFHAFLLIIKYRKVIKDEDLEVVKTLKYLYGPEMLKNYCVLVVTHGDQLKAENASFKDWCLKQGVEFKSLYEECGCRAVVIDNTTEDKEIQKDVLKNLIEKIDDLQFNGRRYTADHFKKAENGRKRMLIEEKMSNILEDTATRCTAMIQSSRDITGSFSKDNYTKLKSLYEESLHLMDAVKLMDEGTSILKCPLSLIKGVQGLLSEKMKFLNAKESERKRLLTALEKEEKKLMKKIERVMEKLRDEEEKLALKQELMSLKELLNDSRTAKTVQAATLQHENLETKVLEARQMEKLHTNNLKTENSVSVQQTDQPPTQYVQTEYPQTEESSKRNKGQHEDYQYSDLHVQIGLKCNHLFINRLTVFLLVGFILLVYKNNDREPVWTGTDPQSLFLEFIEKKVTMLKKDALNHLESNTQSTRELQAVFAAQLEMIKRNQTILLQEKENLIKMVIKLNQQIAHVINLVAYITNSKSFLNYSFPFPPPSPESLWK